MADEAEISVCVRPSSRLQGVGARLIRAAEAELGRHGVERRLLVCDAASRTGSLLVSRMGLERHHAERSLSYEKRSPRPHAAGITVRRATESDIDAITALCADAFGEALERTASFVRSSFESGNRTGYLALLGRAVVGCCFVGREERFTSINTVAIARSEQGKGYGKELLYRVLNEVARGEPEVRIDVDRGNESAYALYRRVGFVERGIVGYFLLPAHRAKEPAIHRISDVSVLLAALLVLWELPQTLLGLVVCAALRARRSVMDESVYGRRRIVRTRGIGVSLGFLVFWFGEADELAIRRHELGHALQSAWLGPVYLLAVGLPSILRAGYSMLYAARHRTSWPRYFDGYPENWANRLAGVGNAPPRS